MVEWCLTHDVPYIGYGHEDAQGNDDTGNCVPGVRPRSEGAEELAYVRSLLSRVVAIGAQTMTFTDAKHDAVLEAREYLRTGKRPTQETDSESQAQTS